MVRYGRAISGFPQEMYMTDRLQVVKICKNRQSKQWLPVFWWKTEEMFNKSLIEETCIKQYNSKQVV